MTREGQQLGGYLLVRRIGSGGMGTVYEAIDADDRRVALKLLHPQVGADPAARDRLRREVATLHRVRHTGVARVLDAEADSDDAFVVTELIDGQTLEDSVVEHGPFEPDELALLARGLYDGLHAIHEAGVVHRDVKPSNVMLTDNGPVLIDFGISQVLDDVRYTQTGMVTGTPGYIDPQVVAGEAPSGAGDWWGWAAILVYAATGRAPFGSGSLPAVLGRVALGDVDTAGLPPRLAAAFRSSLAPTPESRQDPLALLQALEADAAALAAPTDAVPGHDAGEPTTADPAVRTADAPTVTVRADPSVPPTSVLAADATVVTPTPPPVRPPSFPPAPSRTGAPSAPGTPASPDLGTVVATVGTPPAPPPPNPYAPPRPGSAPPAPPASVRPWQPAPVAPPGWTPAPAGAVVPGSVAPGSVVPGSMVPGLPGSMTLAGRSPWGRPAPPARPRAIVVLGLLAACTAMAWPGTTVLVVTAAVVLAATLGSLGRSIGTRRARWGRRRSDAVVAVFSSPLHLLRAALHVAVSHAVGLVAGVGVWWFVGMLAGGATDVLAGPRDLPPVTTSVLTGLAFWVGLVVSWLAPTSRIAREGARSILAVVAPNRTASTLYAVACAVLALSATLLALTGAGSPDWSPFVAPP